MIRIAFLLNFPLAYKGGINYIKNLLYAIDKINDENFKTILFVPKDIPLEYITLFSPYAQIISTSIIKRRTFPWFFDKVCQKIIGYGILTEFLLKRHKINLISHSNYVSRNEKIKSINWIPDFQYLHYPDLWPAGQLLNTKKLHASLAKNSDAIVLSSYDAFKDFKNVYPSLADKAKVLHFVSQPTYSSGNSEQQELIAIQKYAENKPFFYLPNQFWSHKNHILAFKAVKVLKERGFECILLTSGVMEDFRSRNEHIEFLKKFVIDNHLSKNIKFLGVIPYPDVLRLIKKSVAVINPSFFEGWSSTVEEAKTLGATLLLSDIPVHREQNAPGSKYIDPNDENELANYMEQLLLSKKTVNISNKELRESLELRTKLFGDTYINIIRELY